MSYNIFNHVKKFKMKNLFVIIPTLCLLMGCSTTSKVENSKQNIITYNIQVGTSWGGIIEDTKIDAVTGATSSSINFGFHPEFNILDKNIETGIDFLYYKQSFTYLDNVEGFDGKREFRFAELRVPLTYNFQLFKNEYSEGRLLIKLGLSAGYRVYENIEQIGTVPDYTFDEFSIGPTLGLSTTPFTINNKLKLGFYLDLVRGSKVYEDPYITTDEVGNMSNMKFGILLKFR